ncbi:extracellular solute-binding protein [Aquibacillus sp. 3ASR75-54]|uniref:Extracellular solute-binding protein n=2 Tax=Aquibacillus salsiterrae TaxID=2950439 RepID=A0A9X3WDU1_9BACI|nr:ABC transporter substrate-binding protein [Aquibacillus salsiterrae]MDC3416631.1 extracellular solute-binding protein [Aquibacillus salsiterrae]
MKAKSLLYFLIITFILILAACSGQGKTTTPESSENDEGSNKTEEPEVTEKMEEETITITWAKSKAGNVDPLIQAFEEKNPNIKINLLELPDTSAAHDYFVTTFAGKSSEIDVFDADVIWPAEFVQSEYSLPLDRFIERDNIKLDEYFPGTVRAGNIDGRQWAIPRYTNAALLFYRKDIVETPPTTWDELIEMAEEYKGENGTDIGYALQANQYEGLVVNAIEFIEGYGGSVIDENGEVVINSPEAIKGIEKMIEIVQSDITPSNIVNFRELETETAFIDGHAVFARNWPYMWNSALDEERSVVSENVGTALLPAGDKGSAATLGGWMTMISRFTENTEEAWKFVKFITGEEGQKISAMTDGRPPTIEALYEDEDVTEAVPIFGNPDFVETLLTAVPRPVTGIYPEVSDIMQIELSSALVGDITAQQAVENMEKKITEALDQ